MRIVYFNYLYDVKGLSVGSSIHVQELSRELTDLGHEVLIYNLNPISNPEMANSVSTKKYLKEKLGLYRYFNHFHALIANFRYFRNAYKIIQKDRPDVILMRYNRLNFAMALLKKMKKIALVAEMNAPLSYEYRKYCPNIYQLPILPELIERLTLKSADGVYVVSNELKRYYVNLNIPDNKLFVIPNGADVAKFSVGVAPEKVAREIHSLKKPTIGFIGSFHYWHGVENLFRFIKSTIENVEQVNFLLVGSGPMKAQLEKMISSNNLKNFVRFTGHVHHENIPYYLNAMDIVLAIYPKTDFFYFSPLKIFEYMAAGKAIIATRVGQIKEVIEDQRNGLLFEADDFEQLRKKTLLLIQREEIRKKLGESAQETIKQYFTWRLTAQKLAYVFQLITKTK